MKTTGFNLAAILMMGISLIGLYKGYLPADTTPKGVFIAMGAAQYLMSLILKSPFFTSGTWNTDGWKFGFWFTNIAGLAIAMVEYLANAGVMSIALTGMIVGTINIILSYFGTTSNNKAIF